jgi:hypothetical protein
MSIALPVANDVPRSFPMVVRMRGLVLSIVLLFAWAHSSAFGQQPKPKADAPSAGEIGHKLANPLSDTWAIFGQNDLLLFNGDLALNDMKTGVRMIFQPIIPLPLYGEGDNRWMLVSRPQIPIFWDLPVPRFIGDFRDVSFLGDLRVPLLIKPPTGQVLFALGPDVLVPTANKREFSSQQWGLGPGLVGGYMTKKFVTAFFLQYYWGIGGWNEPDKPDANFGSLLYFFQVSLPNAWAIGTGPVITYDHTLLKGNRWNVPVGPTVAKTVLLGKLPVKFELSAYYSVKHEDLYGQRWQFSLDIIPVIPSLVTRPLLGGAKKAAADR